FPTSTSPFLQDVCLTPNGTYNDLQIAIIPIEQARPGFDTRYKIIYVNVGNTILSGNVNLTYEDNVLDFVVAAPNENTQSNGELSWSFSNLIPFDIKVINVTMNLNAPTETPPLNGGDVLTYNATISPTADDENVTDNSFSLKQTVVNSLDPNDKTCLEGDTITPDLIGEYVHYLIRFENTGSASAVNIVVKDIIDTSKFDMSSFVPMTSSHEYIARIQNDNEVEFIFEGIDLPFDDATNDGFVMFKIKTLPSLVVGDTFENSAEIYFDFNFPIITNTEQTTIDTTAGTDDFSLNAKITIFPNPTDNQLQIESKLEFDSIIIYDLTGKEIKRIVSTVSKLTQQIDVSTLKNGIYYISIQSGTSKTVKKFLKK
ncbi:MAG: T9SS type A sorting domain-containing protein, partial [Flavobacteriaceae bacterium]|nr:T9SS type A sorting domain-containing protein [Flavobacteriaceae bacterium]